VIHNRNKLAEDLKRLKHLENKDGELIQKLNEFIYVLNQSDLNSDNIAEIRDRLNEAIDERILGENALERIQQVSSADLSKLDQLDQLEFLLTTNHLDSNQAKRITYKSIFLKIIKVVIGILFVTLGFAMIIMPAPPYFEMFTIFYFTENDGVTLMDLISLIIIATGIYIIVRSISNIKSYE
jgi:hypothetical protein